MKGWDYDRHAVDVCAVVRGGAVLMSRHRVFVAVAALGPRISVSRRRPCGFVMHSSVAQRAEHRLGRRDGSQYQ